jgi:uncharacterized membrane protein YfcA
MFEFFNWNDTGYVIWSNIWWLILAAAIGIYIGWRTCDMSPNNNK